MTATYIEFDYAELNETHWAHDTLAAFEQRHRRIDAQTIYCLFTGAPIGITTMDELLFVIETLDGTPKEKADELAIRVVGSSRPGLMWIKTRVADIDQMRARFPVETLCYLRNGASGVKKGSDFHAEMIRRIHEFQRLQSLSAEQLDSEWFAFYMDEDQKLAESQRAARMMRHWLSETDSIGHAAARAKRIAAIEAEAEAIRAGKKKGRIKIVSERTAKQRERDQRISMADAFLDSILGSDLPATASPAPARPVAQITGTGFRIRVPSTTQVA